MSGGGFRPVVEAPAGTRTFPVIEVFGPTIQGEGAMAGLPTYFVRFGGCDYRCSWCDSMHAVDPEQVRELAVKLTADQIVDRTLQPPVSAGWVTLSGGNPALLNLDEVVAQFRLVGVKVAVETQGTRWRPWLGRVTSLTVSPKPPSSGMTKAADDLVGFMEKASPARGARTRDALKVVVFDEEDYEWAIACLERWQSWPAFLSCGTELGEQLDATAARWRWLCERAARDPRAAGLRVLPQLHVFAWGHARAV